MKNLAWILAALSLGIVLAVSAPGEETIGKGQRVSIIPQNLRLFRRRPPRQNLSRPKTKRFVRLDEKTLERVYGPSVLIDGGVR